MMVCFSLIASSSERKVTTKQAAVISSAWRQSSCRCGDAKGEKVRENAAPQRSSCSNILINQGLLMSEAATPEVRLSLLNLKKSKTKHLQTDEQRCRLKSQIWHEVCVFLLFVSNVA